MSYTQHLISFHIVERENGKNFLAWTYPSITEDREKHILQQCFTSQFEYICFCKNNIWFNIHHHNDHKKFAIILLTRDYQPKKYKVLCDILVRDYYKCQNPVDLVKLYLNLFTVGSCSLQENGTVYSCNLKNFEWSTNIKDFIQSFDLEIILLYTGILLKRRILLFNSNIEDLLGELLAVANLVPSRNVEYHLYPLIESPNQLKGLSFYVAGTTNGNFIKHEALYDLFVDLQSREITVSPQAEEIMSMTKTHKELATFLVKLSHSDLDENEIKQQIQQKTDDILSLLKNMASFTTNHDVKMITVSDLKSKNYQSALENFLFNLALAENMMML